MSRNLVHFRRRAGGISYGRVAGGRGVLIASAVGVLGVVLAVVLLISVAALISSADGLTAGTLVVPLGRIVCVVVLGYVAAVILLVVAARSGSPGRAWICAVLAAIIALGVSAYPIFATASAAVDQARDIIPWILDLIR